MFGHQDDQKTDDQLEVPQPDTSSSDNSSPVTAEPADPSANWPAPTINHGQMLPQVQPASSSDDASDPEDEDVGSGAPAKPISDTSSPMASSVPSISPASSKATASPPVLSNDSSDSNDLLDIKQNALQQLSPLVGHLDQTPEEKFRTLMMMIQAADNQSLIKEAYEAANSITNEKVKAQALLDIVNEINYFTHPHEA